MIASPLARRALSALATAAACTFAAWIIVDTLRAIVPLWSPLPWFDEWATVGLLDAWQSGTMSAGEALFSQHNEHRILVPRLVFLVDDLLLKGGGQFSFVCIMLVQAAHAGLFAAALSRSRQSGQWALAAVVLALMFSLRQVENLSSAFQVQFVGVFAGATLAFMLFAVVIKRLRCGLSIATPLLGSFAAALLTSFTMANGLVTGFVLVAMGLAARIRWPVILACAVWACLLALVYLHGYEPVDHHTRPLESLRHPVGILLYVATYLGSVVSTSDIPTAATAGIVGLAATAAAVGRTVIKRGERPNSLAMVAVMLFGGASALITASGRLGFGIEQALSSRYTTGSIAFWAAQLTYWWMDPPAWPSHRVGIAAMRAAVVVVGTGLCFAMVGAQRWARSSLAEQSFAQRDSADLLMLGLDDPKVVERAAWGDQGVQQLLPMLQRNAISIFATSDFESLGRPVTERGAIAEPDRCGGELGIAVADPALGQNGVRLSGTAWDGPSRRLIRRIVLVDAAGTVVGLGAGAVPGAGRSDWRGFAVAPVGSRLTAYGLLQAQEICRFGKEAVVRP